MEEFSIHKTLFLCMLSWCTYTPLNGCFSVFPFTLLYIFPLMNALVYDVAQNQKQNQQLWMHKVWKFLWNFSVSTNYEFVRFEYVVANRNEWKISIKIFLLSILVGNDICKIIWSFYEEVQSRSDPQIQV